MNGQRRYIAFRHIYDSVPKWEKAQFMRYCAHVTEELRFLSFWARSNAVARNLQRLFTYFHDNVDWWVELKLYVTTDFFRAVLNRLYAPDCVHNSTRTPVQWCSVCLGKFDRAICDPE